MPPPTTTTISASDRIVYVYPDQRTSSGGSASARSHGSSGSSRSFTSSESWSEVEADDDGIEPSDSASRSRHPARHSRRHTVEAREAPSRHSSRRGSVIVEREREEPPRRRHSSRREDSRRHDSHSTQRRTASRRVPSDDSSDNVAPGDDYPQYGRHGMPRAGYQYRQPPPQSHGGYPPSMTSGSGYHDAYAPPHQALMRIQQDPFGYTQQNPFSPTSQQPNPFSPMSRDDHTSYFATDPMGPPPQPHQRHHRPDAPARPQSFAAPHSHYTGSELMAQPQFAAMPGFGPWPGGYPPYPVPGWPHSAGNSPPPKEEKSSEYEKLKELFKQRDAAEEAKKKSEKTSEIENLKELIKKHEEEAIARQKAWIAEREAEAAARAAEKAKAEEEKKRKQEIDDARKKAKEDAEKKAAEDAKKAKEEHDKKLADAEKAKEEADKAKKALEEEIAKNKPQPDMLKAPIKFKDAVGRKFSFPWHLCKTWKGMETLIKQAFLHVDVIGEHVHQGHYDLTGPDGEIILPQVWDSMVKPDYEITMHLWPMEEDKHKDFDPLLDRDPYMGFGGLGGGGLGGGGLGSGGGHHRDAFERLGGAFGDLDLGPMHMPKKSKSGGKKGESSGKKKKSPELGHQNPLIPPPPPLGGGGGHGAYADAFMGLGGGGLGGGGLGGGLGGFPPGISPVVEAKPHKSDKSKARSKSKSTKEISPLAAWFAGGSLSNSKPGKKSR